jgi:hypothetical protein
VTAPSTETPTNVDSKTARNQYRGLATGACALLGGSTDESLSLCRDRSVGYFASVASKPPIEEEPIAVSPNAQPKCPIWNNVTDPGRKASAS